MDEKGNHRSVSEVFEDLRILMQSEGAIHEVSSLIFSDVFLNFSKKENKITNDIEHRYSKSKVIENEILLLLGLGVQSKDDKIYMKSSIDKDFTIKIRKLLEELRCSILWSNCSTIADMPLMNIVQEAIFYGWRSFYPHQFIKFIRNRYKKDEKWLLEKKGLSIEDLIKISKFIVKQQEKSVYFIKNYISQEQKLESFDLTNVLLILKENIIKKFREKGEVFIREFSTPIINQNKNFSNPFSRNDVYIKPLLDSGDILYVPSKYRFFETLYESPYYWMKEDPTYKNISETNSGAWLESITEAIFKKIFGKNSVYKNVKIIRNKKITLGEIDVLIIYGEFIFVVQNKTKRITENTKQGDVESFKKDFHAIIEHPYKQAISCRNHLLISEKLVDENGNIISLPDNPRIFPIVVLSESFLSGLTLSRMLLKCEDNISPIIWDIAILDGIAEIFSNPIDVIHYIVRRAELFHKISVDHEYDILGFYLEHDFHIPDDMNYMMLVNSFSSVVDDFMSAKELKLEAKLPVSIREKLTPLMVSKIISDIKKKKPEYCSIIIDILYNLSTDDLQWLEHQIISARHEVKFGKPFKGFTRFSEKASLGFTYVAISDKKYFHEAKEIGLKNKNNFKANRWYVLVDDINTKYAVDDLLIL